MPKRKRTAEEIINKLREAEVIIASGSTVAEAARRIGVSEETFYRWRADYGGLRVDQARHLKQLETENSRLKRAVAELTLDNQMLKEAAEGNLSAPPVAVCASTTTGQSWGYRSAGLAECWVSTALPNAMSRWYVTTSNLRPLLLTNDIVGLVSRFGRYGYRRITALLRRAGWKANHKRVERIWRRERLEVPVRQGYVQSSIRGECQVFLTCCRKAMTYPACGTQGVPLRATTLSCSRTLRITATTGTLPGSLRSRTLS